MERNSECHNVLVYSKWKETATVTVLWFTLNGKKRQTSNVLVYSKWKETATVTVLWFTLNGKKRRMSQCYGLL